jgi:hypothetical protein
VSVRKRNTITAALRIVGIAYSNWTPEGGKDYFGGYGYVALKLEGKMSFSVQVAAAKGRNPSPWFLTSICSRPDRSW